MKLDLQLTNQSKILLGILVVALIAAIATQWGPGLYSLISNPDMKAKRETLQNSKDLVAASQILKPAESGLYHKTGLSDGEEPTTIFEGNFPETVVREKIQAIVKQAGIPQNIQLNVESVPGKKSERTSPQARRNLVMFSYLKLLENEKEALNAEMQAQLDAEMPEMQIDEDAIDLLMNAWLDEGDVDLDNLTEEEIEQEDIESQESEEQKNPDKKEQEKSDEKEYTETEKDNKSENPDEDKSDDNKKIPEVKDGQEDKSTEQSENQQDSDKLEGNTEWVFSSFPESLPIPIRIELIELIMAMVEQHLVGAQTTLFENEFFRSQTGGTSGIFGIGAKRSKIEISFNPNSQILAKFTNLIDTYDEDLNKKELRKDLLEYLEQIQLQIAELSQKLKLAPTTYSPESFTVKMKFKAELEKLVNLNRIIETTTKWLMVRDLQISTDNKDNKINVEILLIARVYQ